MYVFLWESPQNGHLQLKRLFLFSVNLSSRVDRLQDRGKFFIDPNQEIYKGQVVGENSKQEDMAVNLIKGKKLTNVRASGSDDGVKIAPKIDFSLEECMEYIKDDEYLEVTPQSLRMRKINFVKT